MSIFVVGIGKSGNNLLLKLCQELGYPESNRGLGAHSLNGRFATVKRVTRGAWLAQGVPIGLPANWNVRRAWVSSVLRHQYGRVIGGHVPFSTSILEILNETGYRVLLIKRDPRDVLVSFAHFIGRRPDIAISKACANLTLDGKMRFLLHGGEIGGFKCEALGVQLDRAFGWLDSSRVCSVSFESLVGPMGGGEEEAQTQAIDRIKNHLGYNGANSTIAISDRLAGGTKTFRKGQQGSWKYEMSSELAAEVVETVGVARLNAWGYSVD